MSDTCEQFSSVFFFWLFCICLSSCFLTYFPFIGAFAVPIALILIFNVIIFAIVIHKMHSTSKKAQYEMPNKPVQRISTLAQVRGSLGLCVLLGLTWLFAFFAIEPVSATIFQVLFILFNTSQGIFIFLIYCVMKKDVLIAWSSDFPKLKRFVDSSTASKPGESPAVSVECWV